MFDAMDFKTKKYLDYDDFEAFAREYEIPTVPVLYRGNLNVDKIKELAEGKSTLDNSHIREGVVIRPIKERWHPSLGRVILKLHGEGFLLR